MNRRRAQEPADLPEELEETLEEPQEQAEEPELPASLITRSARPSSSALRQNAPQNPQNLAELAKVVEFNMAQQTRRIAELAEAHEKKSTILDGLMASLQAHSEILEDHTASLEEAMDRLETVVAAHIRLIQSQTSRRELGQNPGENRPKSQNQNTSNTDDSAKA